MCETKNCIECKKDFPSSEFKSYKRKWYLANGEERISVHTLKRCSSCHNKMQSDRARKRRQGNFIFQPKDDTEYYNYNDVKCVIFKTTDNTYKVRTNDIELHYTHYVGLSGDLKVNTHFEHKNASEFINKTYEHRMLLFREMCNLQKQIDTGGACEEIRMFHSAL